MEAPKCKLCGERHYGRCAVKLGTKHLSEKDFNNLVESCENPPEPTPALKALIASAAKSTRPVVPVDIERVAALERRVAELEAWRDVLNKPKATDDRAAYMREYRAKQKGAK